jgi:hypothetical protein
MYRPSRLDLLKSGTTEYAFVRSSTATCFKFFDLSFEYFVGVQIPKPLETKVLSPNSCRCPSCPLFLQTGLQNMLDLYILCLEGGLVSPKPARKTACAAFAVYFHQI